MSTIHRSKIGWIKRRARRIQNFYGVERKLAIHDAWRDWISFMGIGGLS